jgi:hypothetical protein
VALRTFMQTARRSKQAIATFPLSLDRYATIAARIAGGRERIPLAEGKSAEKRLQRRTGVFGVSEKS